MGRPEQPSCHQLPNKSPKRPLTSQLPPTTVHSLKNTISRRSSIRSQQTTHLRSPVTGNHAENVRLHCCRSSDMRKATLPRVSITPKEKIHHPRHSCASFLPVLSRRGPFWFRLELLPRSPRSRSWLLVRAGG